MSNIEPDFLNLGKISSVLGLFKKKDKAPPPVTAQEASYGHIKGQVQAADEFGLHRLATLGGGAGYSGPLPNQNETSNFGNNIQGVSRDLGNAIYQSKKGQDPLMQAQLAESRSRTLLNAANTRRLMSGPTNNPTGITGGLETVRKTELVPHQNMDALSTVELGGYPSTIPNPEAFEIGISELIAGTVLHGPQWLYQFLKNPGRPKRKHKGTGPALTQNPRKGR